MRKLASLVVIAVAASALSACGTASTAELHAIPEDVDFGKVVLNTDPPKQLVAINNSEAYTAVIGTPALHGDPAFSISTISTCHTGAHVSPDRLCAIALSFRASHAGRYSGSLSVPYHYEGSSTTKVTVTLGGRAT
jgi:hypothetical protein